MKIKRGGPVRDGPLGAGEAIFRLFKAVNKNKIFISLEEAQRSLKRRISANQPSDILRLLGINQAPLDAIKLTSSHKPRKPIS